MTNTNDILQELEAAFFDIPFENSDYQNKTFVLAAQITPARAYRAIGLRMSAKLRAINELKFNRQREEVDIDEWQAIIDSPGSTSFAKRRAQIDIDQKLSVRNYTDKLLNDAIHELNMLYAEFKTFPKYTREQFEQEEELHFISSMQWQIEAGKLAPATSGAMQGIMQINHNQKITNFIEEAHRELSLEKSPTQ